MHVLNPGQSMRGLRPGRGTVRPVTLGVLLVGAGLLWFLLSTLRGGGHPLALQAEPVLCELLGESVWETLPFAHDGGIVRVPAAAAGAANYCGLELDPLTNADRFERIARGDDADRVREIVSIMLVTRAALFRQSPSASTADYAEAWSEELQASGWPGQALEGDWRSGELFTGAEGQQGVLIEDDGIVLWITARELETQRLVAFAGRVTGDLRIQP